MPSAKKRREEIVREDRRRIVAADFLSGRTYRQMAAELHVALSTISNDVQVIVGRWQQEQVQLVGEQRQVELQRLDVALQAVWEKVLAGDLFAIDRYLKIAERRSKLLGLDAPTKLAPTTPEGDKPWTLETALTEDFAVDVAQALAEFGLMHLQTASNGTAAHEE